MEKELRLEKHASPKLEYHVETDTVLKAIDSLRLLEMKGRRVVAVTVFTQKIQDLSVFPFLPRHYHMTCMLLSPFITTV